MWEASKDPAIKLFGKAIPLLDIPPAAAAPVDSAEHCSTSFNSIPQDDDPAILAKDEETPDQVESSRENLTDAKVEDGVQPSLEDSANPHTSSVFEENLKTPFADNAAANLKTPKAVEEHSDSSNSQEKSLKKPDKILPCPRCNSMDTKFCYYNNYNLTQPRHFCKNCQRYWTAGGTMRNVPVGAGRRKNKNSASQYRHITVSEALHSARREVPNGIHYPSQKHNGAVLTFGSKTPVFESRASVLNIAETAMPNCSINGFHKPALRLPVPCGSGDNGDSNSSGSSVTAANSMDEITWTGLQNHVMQNCHRYPPQVPCLPGASWPYLCNSAQPVPPSAFCPPSFPIPFYPVAPYWGCTVPGTWNVPWVAPPPCSSNTVGSTSGPMSPTLGKHSRDENELKSLTSGEEGLPKENNAEKCLWVPKTLRMDDPGEAAKSSIWATLGIKNDNSDPVSGVGLFKGFQSKSDSKNHSSKMPPILQANPAALSRSLNFQESS